jgi:hypothetical protein
MDYKITQADWQRILNTMLQYNRSCGFINILDGKLTFFDGNAVINDVGSFYVTQSDVRMFLNNY